MNEFLISKYLRVNDSANQTKKNNKKKIKAEQMFSVEKSDNPKPRIT